MNKKFFIFGLIFELLLALLSLFLAFQFEEQAYDEFSLATAGFLIAFFFFFDVKNADKPMDKISFNRNTLKASLQGRGKLHLYKDFAYTFLALFTFLGFLKFAEGIEKLMKTLL